MVEETLNDYRERQTMQLLMQSYEGFDVNEFDARLVVDLEQQSRQHEPLASDNMFVSQRHVDDVLDELYSDMF